MKKSRLLYKLFEKLAVDVSLGFLVFVIVSLLYRASFSSFWAELEVLIAVVFFANVPDIDYIPFFLLRKKRNWTSHWLIHYPVVGIIVALIVLLLSPYWATLLGVGYLAHLFHDGRDRQGLQFLWPFYKKHIRWEGLFGFVDSEIDYQVIHAELRSRMHKRGTLDELEMRVKDQKMGKSKITFFLISCILAIIFMSRGLF